MRSQPDSSHSAALANLSKVAQKLARLTVESRKNSGKILVAHVAHDRLPDDLAEVGGEGEIAAFVELRLIEARPPSVDFSAFHRTAEDEHDVRMAVIGAAVSVLVGRAAKLRHRDDDRVFAKIAKIGPEGSDRLREVAEHIGQLAFGRSFVDVMVPSSDIGERYLNAEIGFDQLRQLAKAVAEASLGIIRARRGRVFAGISGLEHLHRIESFFARSMQHAVGRVVVHGLESVAAGEAFGLLPPTEKSLMLFIATAGSRPLKMRGSDGPECNGAERRILRRGWQMMQRPIEPSIFRDLSRPACRSP